MKIATWNVNSIRARIDHLLIWLKESKIDIVAIQETKVINDLFPKNELESIGYKSVFAGQKSYNGVAILSLYNMHETSIWHAKEDINIRAIATVINNIRVINVYVPNGQSLGSEKFAYKLNWLNDFIAWVKEQQALYEKIIILGDFNIAPNDLDVYDVAIWQNSILTSQEERGLLQKLLDLGFTDSFRQLNPTEPGFSWWDYRAGSFRRGNGLRIDLILSSNNIILNNCLVDIEPRGWSKPSDHTPVVLSFE